MVATVPLPSSLVLPPAPVRTRSRAGSFASHASARIMTAMPRTASFVSPAWSIAPSRRRRRDGKREPSGRQRDAALLASVLSDQHTLRQLCAFASATVVPPMLANCALSVVGALALLFTAVFRLDGEFLYYAALTLACTVHLLVQLTTVTSAVRDITRALTRTPSLRLWAAMQLMPTRVTHVIASSYAVDGVTYGSAPIDGSTVLRIATIMVTVLLFCLQALQVQVASSV